MFGNGDTNEDVKKAIEEHGQPVSVFYESDGYMAVLVYSDKVVCVGYDGNEYTHDFVMSEKELNNETTSSNNCLCRLARSTRRNVEAVL